KGRQGWRRGARVSREEGESTGCLRLDSIEQRRRIRLGPWADRSRYIERDKSRLTPGELRTGVHRRSKGPVHHRASSTTLLRLCSSLGLVLVFVLPWDVLPITHQ